MVRGKVKLHYLHNPIARRLSFNKRKKSVIRQAEELSTLCNLPVCAVIISPFDSTPTVWPSASGVQDVLQRYNNIPEKDQNKHETNMIEFSKKRLKKLQKQLKKEQAELKEHEINLRINKSLRKMWETNFDADVTDCLFGECSMGLKLRNCSKGESYLDNDEGLGEIESEIARRMKEVDMKIEALKAKSKNDEAK